MEICFNNEYLECIFDGQPVIGKPKYQIDVIKKFIKTVNILKALPRIETAFQLNSLNYEKLTGTKLSSVRVNKKFRLEFSEVTNAKGAVVKLMIVDLSNHYK